MLFSMNCEAGNVVFLWHGDTEQQYNYVDVVVVVSGMQFLRLRSTIRRHHHPQMVVLNQNCCFGSVRWCCFRSCLTVQSHMMWGRPGCLLQSAAGQANRILLASALLSMRINMPK